MRTLDELIEKDEPAIDRIRAWVAGAERPVELLEPSARRGELLVQTQLTTRSPLGAIVHETGGILVDHGWLRFLGSGHVRLGRPLPVWNEGRSHGFLLVADDAVSGFFAINTGGLGDDPGKMYYLPPDSLHWQPLGRSFTRFFRWSLGPGLDAFYEHLRWEDWRAEVRTLPGDRTFAFYPPLWAGEGPLEDADRRRKRVWEVYAQKLEARAMQG